MTQQNAALVEESAAASGSLREQAQRLFEVVLFCRRRSPRAARGRPGRARAAGAAPARRPVWRRRRARPPRTRVARRRDDGKA